MAHIDIPETPSHVLARQPNDQDAIGISVELTFGTARCSALEAIAALPPYAPDAGIVSASDLEFDWIRYYIAAYFANMLFAAGYEHGFTADRIAAMADTVKPVLDAFDAAAFDNMRACFAMLKDCVQHNAESKTPEESEILISSCLGSFVWLRLAWQFRENAELQRVANDDFMCWKLTGAIMRMNADHLIDLTASVSVE